MLVTVGVAVDVGVFVTVGVSVAVGFGVGVSVGGTSSQYSKPRRFKSLDSTSRSPDGMHPVKLFEPPIRRVSKLVSFSSSTGSAPPRRLFRKPRCFNRFK